MHGPRTPKSAGGIRAVERALDVLDFLGARDGPQRLTDISEGAGLSAATTHRVLSVLAARRYVVQDTQTRSYALGDGAKKLGDRHLDTAAAIRRMRPELETLALRIGACVVVCAYEGPRVAILGSFGGEREAAQMVQGLGRYMDAHATAAGRALLSGRSDSELRELYRHTKLRRHTERTVTSIEVLLDRIECVREAGYAKVSGEFLPGLRALGVPLPSSATGRPLALSLTYLRGTRTCSSDRQAAAEAIEITRHLLH